VSFTLDAGETLGVVGESGSGKSTLALALLRLLPDRECRVTAGRILFEGRDLFSLSNVDLRAVRGGRAGMVFQDPFSALNPVFTIGEQIEEVLAAHGRPAGRAAALELLEHVRLPDPARIGAAYPHQVSGGQRQRACLALAIACRPALLIADEPTTALDVTLQKDILDLLDSLQKELGMAIFFITHNMGLVAERTRRLAIMYAGEFVEVGDTGRVLREPLHPYTRGLLQSLPRLRHSAARLPMLAGQPPDLRAVPPGCPFHPRCPQVFAPCATIKPPLRPKDGRDVSCHLHHPPESPR
jgi:oligopeptide transport system ATP-binding protein